MKKFATLAIGLAVIAGLTSCRQKRSKSDYSDSSKSDSAKKSDSVGKTEEPKISWDESIANLASSEEVDAERVTVAHILISFAGTGTQAKRTYAEARALAEVVFDKVQAGEDFNTLAQEYSDDKQRGIAGGPYGMYMPSRTDDAQGMSARTRMVPAFGNVGWKLKVGEVGIAEYDANTSKYGWHIIKRVK